MAEWVGLPDGGSNRASRTVRPSEGRGDRSAGVDCSTVRRGDYFPGRCFPNSSAGTSLPDDFDVEGEQELLAMEGPGYEVGQ